MSPFRSRLSATVYIAAVALVVAALVLLITQPGAACTAPRGTPGVACHGPSTSNTLGIALLGIGWVSLLVYAKTAFDGSGASRWSAALRVCLGLGLGDAVRTVTGSQRRA